MPLSLQQVSGVGSGVGFLSVPAPTSPTPASAGLVSERDAVVLNVSTEWRGRRSSTAAYVTLPRNKVQTPGGYLIGAEYPAVVVHLHGGGTPTATGKNAMSIGERLAPAGIPVLALDLPGHGLATRNPIGLMSMEDHADWILHNINLLVHPGVKVILAGHSWGAMMAVYMHRHSHDPKYARIARFIALSPPVDVSLAGDRKKKAEWEEWFEAHFDDFRDKIAPADFDFMKNILVHGKVSVLGGLFTALTDLDYATRPFTSEEQRGLKPMSVLIGSADYLYAGREELFAQAFGTLEGPSEFIVVGPGQTWKSKAPSDVYPTGHNLFDVFIPGTTIPFVYSYLLDRALEVAGATPTNGGDFAQVKVPGFDRTVGFAADPAGALEVAKTLIPQPSAPDAASQLLDGFWRHAANFFAFREMIASVEYVEVPGPKMGELTDAKKALDKYAIKIDEQTNKNSKAIQAAIEGALDGLRKELGFDRRIPLEAARAELAFPELTDARREELSRYIEAVVQLEEKMRADYVDSQYNADLEGLTAKYGGLMKALKLARLEDYEEIWKENANGKALDEDKERAAKLATDLARLHQDFKAIQRPREARFGQERAARLTRIPTPTGVVDRRMAEREIKADRSPVRRRNLAELVRRWEDVSREAREAAEAEAARALDKLDRPVGVNSPDEGLRLKARQDAILAMTYLPREGESGKLARIVRHIEDLTAERDAVMKGAEGEPSLNQLQKSVEQLRGKRQSLTNRIEDLWASGSIRSAWLKYEVAEYERALAAYHELYVAYRKYDEWLDELKREGNLNAATLLQGRPDLEGLLKNYLRARQVFLKAKEVLDNKRWMAALLGQVSGDAEAVKSASRIALELEGVLKSLKAEEGRLESRRRALSLLQQELNEHRYQYSKEMRALGHPVPYIVERVDIFSALNRDLSEVLRDMRGNPVLMRALTQLKSRWDPILAEIRSANNQGGDNGPY